MPKNQTNRVRASGALFRAAFRYAAAVACLGSCLAACSSDDSSSPVSRDSSTVPFIRISPKIGHLSTAVPPNTPLELSVIGHAMEKAAIEQAVKQAFRMEDTDGSAVQGSWSIVDGPHFHNFRFTYQPTTQLSADQEYLIRFLNEPRIKIENAPHAFRVGSLPRIVEIGFAKTPIDTINLRFSEDVDLAVVASSLTLSTGGQPVSLTRIAGPASGPTIGFTAASPLQGNSTYELTVPVDVGIPAKLDSKYEGAEGSEPFRVSLVPVQHQADSPWRPAVTF